MPWRELARLYPGWVILSTLRRQLWPRWSAIRSVSLTLFHHNTAQELQHDE